MGKSKDKGEKHKKKTAQKSIKEKRAMKHAKKAWKEQQWSSESL